jgi:uncharacterized membrane protein HdeD (DUF308 family)
VICADDEIALANRLCPACSTVVALRVIAGVVRDGPHLTRHMSRGWSHQSSTKVSDDPGPSSADRRLLATIAADGEMDVTAVGLTSPRQPALGRWWWLLLVTGILWILLGLFVLQAHYDSAVAIGLLVGIWLIFGGVAEFLEAGLVEGWKWLHIVLGVLFVIGGVFALTAPFQTFTVLASLVGFFLIVKGTFDFVMALMLRHELDLWWMTLIAGIVEILLGVWAMGYPGRSAALLILWVGFGALVRGIVEIIGAFRIRRWPAEVAA